jgi:ABC-type antimicrobial peptide transport system permease subunit
MRFQDEAQEMAFAVYTISAAGTVALVLSATGLYAVLSYIVALRRREIDVRLAIGAPPSRIITLVIRQALKLVLGMACGLALAVPMAFAMRATFVAKVTGTDPMVFLPTISLLLAVGILAAAVPALRASRIDPIATLRQE